MEVCTTLGVRPDQDLDMVEQCNGQSRQFEVKDRSYAVGTHLVTICNGIGAQNVTAIRKKISGGTVTSVILQGLVGIDSTWATILTLADDTVGVQSFGQYVAAGNENPQYEKLRLQIIIATSAVVLDWSVSVR